MTHGSLLRRYGIDTLVRATRLLQDDIPELEVWIVGDGEHRESLEKLAVERGVHGHVRFLGWVPIERVAEYIAKADIGVVPVSAHWLLPNKLFEYVAMGKPVVASASPAIEAIFSGNAIAYVKPDDEQDLADKILEFYRSPTKARCLIENASRSYERFKWEVTKRAYVEAHEQLIAPRS
jgi:glycosyltransferase involved in cell wall biosynthesis